MPKIIDLTGRKFGRLEVIEKRGVNGQGLNVWLCGCECGNSKLAVSRDLTSGHTRSCGCLRSEEVSKRFKTHGMKNTRMYRIWQNMKSRCTNPNFPMYKYYGEKGITICEEWLNSFEAFYSDMKEGYSDDLTIDRIDNDKGYCKENCKWSTNIEQANNTSSNRILAYNGELDTLANMCRKYGQNYSKVKSRLRYGWPVDKALTN